MHMTRMCFTGINNIGQYNIIAVTFCKIQEQAPANPSKDFWKIQNKKKLHEIEIDFSSARLHAVKYY